MTDTEIEDWALEKAKEIRNAGFERGDKNITETFARYIQQHEEPPVDSDLVKAREIAAELLERDGMPDIARQVREGKSDDNGRARAALAGIKWGKANA